MSYKICEKHLNKLLHYNDHTLREWIGYSYTDFLDETIEWIKSKGFDGIEGLSDSKIAALRTELSISFKKGESIRQIAARIRSHNIPDLDIEISPEYDADGKLIRRGYSRMIPGNLRAELMARTETIKASAEGSLKNYKNNMNIERVQWSAAVSDRTCIDCMDMNGRVFSLGEAHGLIPKHCLCRCCFLPITSD